MTVSHNTSTVCRSLLRIPFEAQVTATIQSQLTLIYEHLRCPSSCKPATQSPSPSPAQFTPTGCKLTLSMCCKGGVSNKRSIGRSRSSASGRSSALSKTRANKLQMHMRLCCSTPLSKGRQAPTVRPTQQSGKTRTAHTPRLHRDEPLLPAA